jgi:hypothetical protein
MMYSDYNDRTVLKLHASKQRDYEKLAAEERLAKIVQTEKRSLKCLVCEKLAMILLAIGWKLLEQAQMKPVDELPTAGI